MFLYDDTSMTSLVDGIATSFFLYEKATDLYCFNSVTQSLELLTFEIRYKHV